MLGLLALPVGVPEVLAAHGLRIIFVSLLPRRSGLPASLLLVDLLGRR